MRRRAIFALAILGAAALAFFFLRRHPPAPPPVVLHPTPQRLAQAQSDLEAFQKQMTQPEESLPAPAIPAKTHRLIAPRRSAAARRAVLRTLRVSEEDLNVYLAGNQATRKLLDAHGVRAVQLVLAEPANMTIHAAVALKGRTQNVQLDGTLAPDPKMGLRYNATHAQVGRFSMPSAVVTAQGNALAASLLKKVHGRLPLAIQSVQVQGKMLVLTGILLKRGLSPHQPPAPRAAASPQSASPARHSQPPPASPPQTRPL